MQYKEGEREKDTPRFILVHSITKGTSSCSTTLAKCHIMCFPNTYQKKERKPHKNLSLKAYKTQLHTL